MSGDYKYEISLLADEIALKRHGKDYYELPEPVQVAIFNEAGTASILSGRFAALSLWRQDEIV